MSKFKQYLIYIFYFIIIFFIIPALCTKKQRKLDSEVIADVSDSEKNTTIQNYNYTKFSKIKLLHNNDGTVEELPLDEYLYGVVSAEMPVNFEIEALKAQAVAARTYTIFKLIHSDKKHSEQDADICDEPTCCQAWISKEERFQKWKEEERNSNWEKIAKAVNDTTGKIITYNNEPINAFFHSNSGGVTEVVSNVWGGKDLPYLQSVETLGETEYSQYRSEVKITKQELIDKLKNEYKDIEINFEEIDSIKILNYTENKRVKTVKFGNIEIPGTKVRSIFELKSTNFEIKIEGDYIIFSVIGYGHGVGMSQTGADSMAKSGSGYEDILKHFYTGVEIRNF